MSATDKSPGAPVPSPEEMARARRWASTFQQASPAGLPFCFSFGGKPSSELLAGWKSKRTTARLSKRRTRHALTFTDPATGLIVRCAAVEYADFPVVEWTVTFENAGKTDTPILADIQAIDLAFQRKGAGEFTLRTMRGDDCTARSYEPIVATLGASARRRLAPLGGRPTNGAWPYYNLQWGKQGAIVVIGWPGQWAARFDRDKARGLRVRGGQERTHFKLRSGEQVRTPLGVLMCYQGDPVRAHNLWRRWMIAHNLPRPGGKLPPPFSSTCLGLRQSQATEIAGIDAHVRGGVKLDYWWMDAGWYPCEGNWWKTGTWKPDPQRFPRGIRPVSDHAHANGMKLVLWFEPERVHPGTELYRKHPQWLLGADGGNKLLDLGNPAARKWLTDHVDKTITEQGIDLYRQDFNFDPLGYWRGNDAPDRQGITENLHVQGYLAYWDELRRRHPGMLIDSCASGGRRNDLETLRRAVPLLRSDYQGPQKPDDLRMMVGNQGHTYGLAGWVPYYGTGVYCDDLYGFRSHLCPAQGIGWDPKKGKPDWAAFRAREREWRQIAGDFYGDYYPLTDYSLSRDAWIAWQFHRPEARRGFVQAFRRERCREASIRLKLRGLDPDGRYELTDPDRPGKTEATGRALMERGLAVELGARPAAAIIAYRQRRP